MPHRFRFATTFAVLMLPAVLIAAAEDPAPDEEAIGQLEAKAEQAGRERARAAEDVISAAERLRQLERDLSELRRQLKQSEQSLEAAKRELEDRTVEWLARRQAVEHALREAGKWVSFRAEVAPILNDRCVACHNARTAEGRLNLASYAALMNGGESGPAVDPGDGEFSTLCLMIEDGSMPKDADPLTEEQIALIKRWVELGAALDAGVDPDDTLIRIMPKRPHPAAPEDYSAPFPVTAVAFSPDGKLLATSGYHEVLLWDAADGTLVRRIGNIAERVADLEFHPDGERLAVAAGTPGQLGEALIVNTSDGSLVTDLVTVEDALFAASFSPDGARLAVAGADRTIRLFDVATGEEQTIIEDHADWVMDLAWSPDGTKLVSASRDKTAKVFDVETGDALATFNRHGEVVYGAAFLPDGATVATAGRDKHVRIWTIEKGDQTREIGGFGSEVFQVVTLSDGRVVSCGADRVARLHNASDGAEIRAFAGHSDWVYAAAVHPDSSRLATGSYDGEVRVWNLETGESVLSFLAAPRRDGSQ